MALIFLLIGLVIGSCVTFSINKKQIKKYKKRWQEANRIIFGEESSVNEHEKWSYVAEKSQSGKAINFYLIRGKEKILSEHVYPNRYSAQANNLVSLPDQLKYARGRAEQAVRVLNSE